MAKQIELDTKEISDYFFFIQDIKVALSATQTGMRRNRFALLNKIAENLSGKILKVQTGTLRRRRDVSDPHIDGNEVVMDYGSKPIAYAAIHEFGGFAGRGLKVKIPARHPYSLAARALLDDKTFSDNILLELASAYKRGR